MISKENIHRQLGLTLNRFPWLKSRISHMMFLSWQRRVAKQSSETGADDLNINRTVWVDPNKIQYTIQENPFHKYQDRGRVVDGDWDLATKPFEELDITKAIRARFVDGYEWAETEFYTRVLSDLSAGKVKWGCRTQEEFAQRCLNLEQLFSDIRSNGYRPQSAIAADADNPYKAEDEISIHIARDGQLLFDDGRHRLAIAQILEIDSVPVKVTARHTDWVQFRKEIRKYAQQHDGRIYHRVMHPDLQDIDYVHGDERFDIMHQHLPIAEGRILDVGAQWGYFSHRFEEMGFDCHAIENDVKAIYFLKKLRQAQECKFSIIEQSILDYHNTSKYDLVIAMSIFHHFLKTKPRYEAFVELLQRLEMGYMYFQPHEPNSAQMNNSYRNYTSDEFIEFIIQNSVLTDAEFLGKASDQRPIYLLSR